MQYIPIENQINMLETNIINTEADLAKLQLKKNWYNETTAELDKLYDKISENPDLEINDFITILKSASDNCKSSYAKSTIFNYYKTFYIQKLNYENNYTESVSIKPRKTVFKTAVAFVVFLFISVVFVLLNEALKTHNKKK